MGPALRPNQPLDLHFHLAGFSAKDQKAFQQKYNANLRLVPAAWLAEYACIRFSVPGIGELGSFSGVAARTLLPLVLWGFAEIAQCYLSPAVASSVVENTAPYPRRDIIFKLSSIATIPDY